MHDIRWIRENPAAFDTAMKARFADYRAADLIALDDERRAHVTKLQVAQESRNSASKEIGKAKASGDEGAAQAAIAAVSELKAFIQSGEDVERQLTAALTDTLAEIPIFLLVTFLSGLEKTRTFCCGKLARSQQAILRQKNILSWAKLWA